VGMGHQQQVDLAQGGQVLVGGRRLARSKGSAQAQFIFCSNELENECEPGPFDTRCRSL
jgi:hypothetical protein